MLMEKVTVPEGKSGEWEVSKFIISEKELGFAMFRYGSRSPRPGEYTKLTHCNAVIMSDTDAEMRDHYVAVINAQGHVLINGLGLGMVLQACMEKEEVTKATVVEKAQDVINLVEPHYKKMYGDNIEIIHADALIWNPPKKQRYGMVWHDIWENICGDNYEEMKTLHRRFGRRADWQGSWCKYETIRANQ